MLASHSVSRSLFLSVAVACLALGACRSAEIPTSLPSPPAVPSPTATRQPTSTLPPAASPTPAASATPSPAPTATPSPIPTPTRIPIRGDKSSTILVSYGSFSGERGDLDSRLLIEDLPSFALYADGRMLFNPPKYPDMRWFDEVRLSPEQVCDWMNRIYATGFMEAPGTGGGWLDPIYVAPEPTQFPMFDEGGFLTIDVRGVPHKMVRISMGEVNNLIPEVKAVLDLFTFIPPKEARQSPKDRVTFTIDAVTPVDGAPQNQWPGTLPPILTLKADYGRHRNMQFEGSQAAELARAMPLPGVALFTDKGKVYRVVGRPLLPHEQGELLGRLALVGTDFPACAGRPGPPRPTSTVSPEVSKKRSASVLERANYNATYAGLTPAQPAQADWRDWHILDGTKGEDLGVAYVFSSTASCDELIDFYALEGVRVGLTFRGMITSEVRISYPPEKLVWSCGVHVLLFRSADKTATPTWTIVQLDTRPKESLVVIADPATNYLPQGNIRPGPWPSVIGVDSTFTVAGLPAPRASPLENWRGWSIKDALAGAEYDQGYLFSSKASCADLEAFYSGTGAPAELGEGLPFAEFADADADAACKRTIITYRASENNRRDYRVYVFMGDDGPRVLIQETK